MIKFTGKSVCTAIAIGHAKIIKKRSPDVEMVKVASAEDEISRFQRAKGRAVAELTDIYKRALREVGEANARIFEIHLMMLEDEDYNESVISIIRSQEVNAEYAISQTCSNLAYLFSTMDDSYMKERASDIRDVSARLISCLNDDGSKDAPIGDEKFIICAADLAPSETVSLEKERVLAFLTAFGSQGSHTAILARSMDIPAIVSLGEDFLSSVRDGDMLCVDGYTGEVFINPDEKTLSKMMEKQRLELERRELLKNLKGKGTVTLDGRAVKLYANIGGVQDVAQALFNDAEGIGLFRSEFIYLGKDDFPSEEEQFAVYKRVLESMGERRVIIRTLDIGADKQATYFNIPSEENPALGMRGIRICLSRPLVFKTQIRALYRASAYGRLGIMFPMITSEHELRRIHDIINDVKHELDAEKIKYSNDVELGIMIETPASAIISDLLAPLVNFFSVGTNDLTQYTLACDRQNPSLDDFCDTHHRAILRLIDYSAKSIHANGGWIGICGELASDTSLTEAFLRMGIDELSVSPSYILKVRDTIRKIDLSK